MTTLEPATDQAVLSALTAARALEAEGQYSAAKLFRAAALGQALRATRDYPRSSGEMERAMADALAAWREARGTDALATAMERVSAAVRDGRQWVTLDEAPPPFVCRSCGEVMLGDAPPACPQCGARRLTFAAVPPIYFLEPLNVETLLQALRQGMEEVSQLCGSLDDAQSAHGSWPPREIIQHLITAQDMLGDRVRRMLEENEPFLASISPPVADPGAMSFVDLIGRFLTGRQQLLSQLEALQPAPWERTGFHPEWGRITVRQQLSYLAHHEHSHLGELAARCAAAREKPANHRPSA
jgi:DinB superfamily